MKNRHHTYLLNAAGRAIDEVYYDSSEERRNVKDSLIELRTQIDLCLEGLAFLDGVDCSNQELAIDGVKLAAGEA